MTQNEAGNHSTVPYKVAEEETVCGFLNKCSPKFQPPFKKIKKYLFRLLANESLAKQVFRISNVTSDYTKMTPLTKAKTQLYKSNFRAKGVHFAIKYY